MDPDSTLCIIGIILLYLLTAVFNAFKNAFMLLRDWKIENENETQKTKLSEIIDSAEKFSLTANAIAVTFETVAVVWGVVEFYPVFAKLFEGRRKGLYTRAVFL